MSATPDRKPTLHEADVLLREALARGDKRAIYTWAASRGHRNRGTVVIDRCECGNIVFDDASCVVCRALAQMIISRDSSSLEDLDLRYQLAERTLDRVAAVVAQLKSQQAKPQRKDV